MIMFFISLDPVKVLSAKLAECSTVRVKPFLIDSIIQTNSLDSGYDDKIDAPRNLPREYHDSSKPG